MLPDPVNEGVAVRVRVVVPPEDTESVIVNDGDGVAVIVLLDDEQSDDV